MRTNTRCTLKPIDRLSADYFICDVTARGIPAQAAALIQPAEPDVGIDYEYADEILIYDRRGYEAGWLERNMTDQDCTEVEVQVWEKYREVQDSGGY